MYESFVGSPTGATEPEAEEAIDLDQVVVDVHHQDDVQGCNEEQEAEVVQGQVGLWGFVGVQAVDPKVPGNGASHAPLPMLVRQRQFPTLPTASRSAARLRSSSSLFGLHHAPSGIVSRVVPPYKP